MNSGTQLAPRRLRGSRRPLKPLYESLMAGKRHLTGECACACTFETKSIAPVVTNQLNETALRAYLASGLAAGSIPSCQSSVRAVSGWPPPTGSDGHFLIASEERPCLTTLALRKSDCFASFSFRASNHISRRTSAYAWSYLGSSKTGPVAFTLPLKARGSLKPAT